MCVNFEQRVKFTRLRRAAWKVVRIAAPAFMKSRRVIIGLSSSTFLPERLATSPPMLSFGLPGFPYVDFR